MVSNPSFTGLGKNCSSTGSNLDRLQANLETQPAFRTLVQRNWEIPWSPLLRVLPLHTINLGHAGIAYRCDMALWRDGYEILHSIKGWVQPCKLRE